MKFSKENAHLSEKKFTILHLSDLHFGPKYKYDAEPKYGSHKKYLIDDIRKDLAKLNKRPECIVVSGDLTEDAQETEFENCRLFLIDLCNACNLDIAKDLVIMPGNHDVCWKARTDRMKNYGVFFKKLFDKNPNEFFCMVRGFKGDVNVTVVGLNSCIVESEEAPGIGSVGSEQLDFVNTEMKNQDIDGREFIKIAAMHHHLVPVKLVELIEFEEDKEDSHKLKSFSLTHDSGYILAWLEEHGFSIVLHGHQHLGFLGSERRADKNKTYLGDEVLVLGVGSIAIEPNETAEGFNSYNLIEIDGLGRMTVETRKSKGPEKGWGFVQECVYHLPLLGSIETVIADTLENIVKEGNAYLSDFAKLSNIEKTVIRFLEVLGAIRFEKKVPMLNDYKDNKAELGTSFVKSLLMYIKMPSKAKAAFFNGWEKIRRFDSTYSIRQIIAQGETRRSTLLKEKNLPETAQEEEYVLFVLIGRLVDTGEKCCLMRRNIGWDKGNAEKDRAYLVPAQRLGPDALRNFCFHDLGVELKDLPQLKEVFLERFEETKVSPKSGLLTKYHFEARGIWLDKERAELVDKKAKYAFSNRTPLPHSHQEHDFKWYTEKECKKDKYMMEVNGTVVRKVFKHIKKLGDKFVSFNLK